MINLFLLVSIFINFLVFGTKYNIQLLDTLYLNLTFFSQWPKTYLGTIFFIVKLTISWFIIVWLRLNLFRYRFDQVASYTWHELVILAVFFLVSVLILQYVF